MYCQSSLRHARRVVLYVTSSLDFTSRLDLSLTEQEYEAVWTEIKNPKSKSISCCCTYRHLNTDISKFTKYFSSCLLLFILLRLKVKINLLLLEETST